MLPPKGNSDDFPIFRSRLSESRRTSYHIRIDPNDINSYRAAFSQAAPSPYATASGMTSLKSRISNVHSSDYSSKSQIPSTSIPSSSLDATKAPLKPVTLRQTSTEVPEKPTSSAIEMASKLSGPQPGEDPVILNPDLPTETLFAMVLHARNHYAALGFIGNRILSAFTIRSDVFPTFNEENVQSQSDPSTKLPTMPKVTPLNQTSPETHSNSTSPPESGNEQGKESKGHDDGAASSVQSKKSTGGSSRALLNLPHVTAKEVERRYRQLAVKIHPDKINHPLAERAFQRLSEAFAVLRDDAKRFKYDASLDDFTVLLPFYRRGSLPLPEETQGLLENPQGDECVRQAAYGNASSPSDPRKAIELSDMDSTSCDKLASLTAATISRPASATRSKAPVVIPKVSPLCPRSSSEQKNIDIDTNNHTNVSADIASFDMHTADISDIYPPQSHVSRADPSVSELEAAYLELCKSAEAALPSLAPDPVAEARLARFALAARARELSRKQAGIALMKAQAEAKDFLQKQRQTYNEMYSHAKSVVSGQKSAVGKSTHGASGSLRGSCAMPTTAMGTSKSTTTLKNPDVMGTRRSSNSSSGSQGVSFEKLGKAYARMPSIADRPTAQSTVRKPVAESYANSAVTASSELPRRIASIKPIPAPVRGNQTHGRGRGSVSGANVAMSSALHHASGPTISTLRTSVPIVRDYLLENDGEQP